MFFSFESLSLELLDRNDEDMGWRGHAAVLVPLVVSDDGFSLILTKRSMNLRHHRGEVAFPGGMWEPNEQFPIATALRETHEEISLCSNDIEVKGILPSLSTRRGTSVSPVVAIVSPSCPLIANPEEIDDIFSVPLLELKKDSRLRTDIFNRNGHEYWVPAYQYKGYEVWGLTAWIIKTLLITCFDVQLSRKHTAPEKVWFLLD